MNRPNLNKTSKEVIEYIAHLEAALHGSSELMKAINIANDVIAQEILDKVASGVVLSDDKTFDKIMILIEKAAKVRALSEPKKKEEKEKEKEQQPLEAETIEEEKLEEKQVMRNISDLALSKKKNAG